MDDIGAPPGAHGRGGEVTMAQFSLFRRKKLIMKFTPLSIVLEALAFVALGLGFVVMDLLYPALPATVPTAFAADGSVLATGVKEVTLVHLILGAFVFIILLCINIIARQSCPPDRPLPTLGTVLNALSAAKALFLAYETGRTWYAMSLRPAPGWMLYALIGAELIVAAAAALIIIRRRAGGAEG